MTGLTAILVLAGACWLMRITFIVLVPPEKVPKRLASALDHVAPAVLAALVSVGTVGMMRSDHLGTGLLSLGSVAVIATVAYRVRILAVSAGLGLAAAVLIDLVLT